MSTSVTMPQAPFVHFAYRILFDAWVSRTMATPNADVGMVNATGASERVELLNVSGCEGATASVGIQVVGSTSP